MFPKTGNTFQNGGKKGNAQVEYRDAVWRALTSELGGTHQATKAAMRWTCVSERTTKNWISGSYRPTAEHLIELMRHSDTVLAVVLELAGRNEATTTERLKRIREELEGVLTTIETICAAEDDQTAG
ncbi:XRE family transcriptional regulator [uncultured Roseobacter sp.]|uniref:XRE family transcriptional regulator n=1 Tax=uncultured Roseobacter sp. TaxID=114847 RepID=UPI0026213680|nr:XRE family transcriptional regulator [uncultured Roseobacter sp.]